MGRFRILTLLFVLFLSTNKAGAATITVGISHKIKSINEAIKRAATGDTIEVTHGTYNENVIVSKPLTLKGIRFPSVNAGSKDNVMLITADNVHVEDFRIENSGRSSLHEYCGIKVDTCRGVTIKGNKFGNNSIGIYLKKSASCSILDNVVTTSITKMPVLGNAIHCWNSDSLTIRGNKVSRHRDGIYLEFVKDSDIEKNIVEDCKRYGLHFMFSHRDNYKDNVFRRNGAGVAVMYSRQVNMMFNLFEYNISNISYGLLLKDISGGSISNNHFYKNSIAIYMDGTNLVELRNNVFEENGLGIRIVASSENNRFYENDFRGNTFDVTTNGRTVNNLFKKNYWDKYRGYDLNKDGYGDIPHHPLSLFSMISEYNPMGMLFFHSIIANLLDISEKISPTVTPDNFVDERPAMKQIKHD